MLVIDDSRKECGIQNYLTGSKEEDESVTHMVKERLVKKVSIIIINPEGKKEVVGALKKDAVTLW